MQGTKFNMIKDIAGYNGFGLVPSEDIQDLLLTSSVVSTMTVPTANRYYIAIFSTTQGANVFVDCQGGTATAPGSGTASATTSELNPQARLVAGGSTISVLTTDPSGSYFSAAFYVVNPYVN